VLTDLAIRRARKPDTGTAKLSDSSGLFQAITPASSKLRRMRYKLSGKEMLLSFGRYADVLTKIGAVPVSAVTSQQVLDAVRAVEPRPADSARRLAMTPKHRSPREIHPETHELHRQGVLEARQSSLPQSLVSPKPL
jgi:hypothetical protein